MSLADPRTVHVTEVRAAWGRSTREWGAEGIAKRANVKRKQKSEHQQTTKQVGQSKSWMLSMDDFFLHFSAFHHIPAPLQGASRLFFHSSLLLLSRFSLFPHISNPIHSSAPQQLSVSCYLRHLCLTDSCRLRWLQIPFWASSPKWDITYRNSADARKAMRANSVQGRYVLRRAAARSALPVLLPSGKRPWESVPLLQRPIVLACPDSFYEELTNMSSPLPLFQFLWI